MSSKRPQCGQRMVYFEAQHITSSVTCCLSCAHHTRIHYNFSFQRFSHFSPTAEMLLSLIVDDVTVVGVSYLIKLDSAPAARSLHQ